MKWLARLALLAIVSGLVAIMYVVHVRLHGGGLWTPAHGRVRLIEAVAELLALLALIGGGIAAFVGFCCLVWWLWDAARG